MPDISDPNPHQLRLFLALAEDLHFKRAAARLHMSQPALSQQIRKLENQLGVVLFERDSRSVELTPAGRALVPEARAVLEALSGLRRTASAHHRELTGQLLAGSIGAEAAMEHVRAVLDELQRRHPKLSVQVIGLNIIDHMAALISGEVDVVFLRPPVPEGIQTQYLAEEPRVACLPADDPLAALPSVTLDQLAGRTVVDVPSRAPRAWWKYWVADPRPDGSPVRYGPVVPDLEGLLHAVVHDRALAFLPSAAARFYPRPGLAYVEVSDLPPSQSALAWLAAHRDRSTVAAIRAAARAVAGTPTQGG
ncbi:LysR family transcriptional regulator [Streptomyces sp. NPDC051041]|uniref:LysR family transcriptional regulator n=1 Tax=Streptomyces sp. NPDC051041 TaxID=3365640 RepID=UPI0037A26636